MIDILYTHGKSTVSFISDNEFKKKEICRPQIYKINKYNIYVNNLILLFGINSNMKS